MVETVTTTIVTVKTIITIPGKHSRIYLIFSRIPLPRYTLEVSLLTTHLDALGRLNKLIIFFYFIKPDARRAKWGLQFESSQKVLESFHEQGPVC